MWNGKWWWMDPWVIQTREKNTYTERQESGTGISIRSPWKRLTVTIVLLILNCITHFVNPIAFSYAMVSIPVYGTAYNFLLREMLDDDTTTTSTIRVSAALLSIVFGCIITRALIFPFLRNRFTMFSCGHAKLRHQFSSKMNGGLVPATYRKAHGSANGGKSFVNELHIASDSQGSWALMCLIVPCIMAIAASIYNGFVPTSLTVTDTLPLRYVDMYPGLCAFSLAMNIFIIFSTCDVMLQDNIRCKDVYDDSMKCLRSIWRHQWVRIPVFWFVFPGTILLAFFILPTVREKIVSDILLYNSHDIYLMESWRCVMAGATVMLDLLVLMQDWDFPTMSSPKGIYIPGFATESLTLRIGRYQLVFTCKWIITSLIVTVLPVDIWTFVQQLKYTPMKYGQLVNEYHQILAVTNTSLLDSLSCGSLCYELDGIHRTDLMETVGRYFGWPMEDKMPSLFLVLFVLFLFTRMLLHEDSRYVVSNRMQGVKEESYRRQLESTSLPARALFDLERLAEIKRMYSLRRHADDICVGLSMFGLLLMLIQLRCIWQVRVIFASSTYPVNMVSSPGQTYSLLIFLSTLFLLSQTIHRFKLTVDILKLRNKLPPSATIWRHPTIRFQLILELIVNLCIVPPFLTGFFIVEEFQMRTNTSCNPPMVMRGKNMCYLVLKYPYETLGMFMFFRLYWIVRLVRNHSGFYGQRVDFIGSLNNVSTDSPLWHFRAIFYHKPVMAFLTCTIITWVATAVGVSVMERPLPSPLDSEITAMWMIIVTMATVGYGDYVPRTYGGRVITVLGGIIGGVIVISMLTSLFMGSLQTTRGEEKVLHVVRYKRWQRQRLNASVNLIASAWRLMKIRKSNKPIEDANRKLFKYMQQVRELRLGAVSEGEDTAGIVRQWQRESIDPILKRLSTQRNNTVDELEQKIHKISDLVHAIHALRSSS